jgi:hypothetical protein
MSERRIGVTSCGVLVHDQLPTNHIYAAQAFLRSFSDAIFNSVLETEWHIDLAGSFGQRFALTAAFAENTGSRVVLHALNPLSDLEMKRLREVYACAGARFEMRTGAKAWNEPLDARLIAYRGAIPFPPPLPADKAIPFRIDRKDGDVEATIGEVLAQIAEKFPTAIKALAL